MKLEPCPFCNREPVGPMRMYEEYWILECASCGLRMQKYSMDNLYIAWNTRAPDIGEDVGPCDHEWEPCNAVKCENCGLIVED
jgi:transcription elongation factor Elf1